MKYVLLRIFASLCVIANGYITKTVKVDTVTQLLWTSIMTLLLFSIILGGFYYTDKNEFIIRNKALKDLSNDPFKNLFTLPIVKLSLPGTISYILQIIILRSIPYSLYTILIPLFVIPSVFFNHFMSNAPITTNKIISIVISLVGIFIASFKTLVKDFNKFKNLSVGLGLVTLFILLIAYQTSYNKYLLNEKFNYIELTCLYYILSSSIGIVLSLAYIFIYKPIYKVKTPLQYDMKGLFLLGITSIFELLSSITRIDAMTQLPEYLTILLGYIKIPIALLISYFYLKEDISYYKIIGAILIIIGMSYSDIETLVLNKSF